MRAVCDSRDFTRDVLCVIVWCSGDCSAIEPVIDSSTSNSLWRETVMSDLCVSRFGLCANKLYGLVTKLIVKSRGLMVV
jgi:hypothetical protein